MLKRLAALLGTGTCLATAAVLPAPASAQSRSYDIPAGSLRAALDAWARQSQRQVIYRVDDLRGVSSPGARGALSADAALDALLAGTGFVVRTDPSGAVAVVREGNAGAVPAGDDEPGAAQEPIVVTGSRIRRLEAIASPLSTYSREDIERTTRTDVGGFLQILPQNFSGGSLPLTPDGVFGSGSGRLLPKSGATSPNLRGLGAGSTLTLVNGHRIAAGAGSAFADVGSIPLSVIERIDIVADGASAVYGSDAVGGVVNIVLRDELEGAETSASYELTDDGHYANADLSQSAGANWDSGGLLVSGRYRHRGDLETQDRPFARDIATYSRDGIVIRPQLYPEQEEYSAFMVARQDLGSAVRATADAWYGHRNHQQAFGSLDGMLVADTESRQLSLNGGLRADLPGDVRVDLTAGYSFSRDRTDQNNYSHAFGLDYAVVTNEDFDLTYVNLSASGDIVQLPGGALSFAAGGEHRREDYATSVTGSAVFEAEVKRRINSLYGELLVPLVGEVNSGPLLRRVSLSLAGRYDSYSDVGDTWNGKIGALVGLGRSLTLRATYSTAFRAPTLSDTADSGFLIVQGLVRNFLSPDRPGDRARVIALRGNAELEPETARILTLGADLRPPSIPGLSLSATFFNYNYRNRLTLPPFQTDALLQPDLFGALVRPVSSVGEIEQLVDDAVASGGFATFQDPTVPLSAYEYIVDLRLANIASQRVRGIDLDVGYRFTLSGVRFDTRVTGTYLIHDRRQIAENSSAADYVGLFGEPADLRLRGHVAAQADSFSVLAAVNHVSGFENTNLLDRPGIDAFTTVDLDLQYRFAVGALGGTTTLAFGIRNLFDTAPPFVERPDGDPDYDPANANPLGRVFLVRLNQTW